MKELWSEIYKAAERCHGVAERRGKDTSALGCWKSLAAELREYWRAVDEGKSAGMLEYTLRFAEKLPDDSFVKLYEAQIHNTREDELADMLIVTATWQYTVVTSGELDCLSFGRSVDDIAAQGAVSFVEGQAARIDMDESALLLLLALKIRYNELRKD